MKYDFDEVIDRADTNSLKWDKYKGQDVLPMWVADMDFKTPPAIVDALRAQLDHAVLGYTLPGDDITEVVIDRAKKLYGWHIAPEWLVWIPGLVCGLNICCRAIGETGDEVMSFVPVYPPFLSSPKLSGRNLATVPLKSMADGYGFDVEAFKAAVTDKSKLFLLCNPHNPVGRVFREDELREIAEVCRDNGIVICSDEVHCDLILDNIKHVPIAMVAPDIADITITLVAPSKTFNVPGVNCSLAIIPNDRLRHQFNKARAGIVPYNNALGLTACLAAWRDCSQWHGELLDYLRGNRDILEKEIAGIPGLAMGHVEATYLAWINVEGLKLDDPAGFFEKAGVGIQDSREFGGSGFIRLNFGCRRAVLIEGLNRIRQAISGRK